MKKINLEKNNKGLMAHVILNYPNSKTSDLVIKELASNGSSFVELQIPFSDPLADGPVISAASEQASKGGVKMKKIFSSAKIYANKCKNTNFIFIVYANIIFQYGIENFIRESKKSGVWGVIVPDMPFSSLEGRDVVKFCNQENLQYIPIVSELTSLEHLQFIEENIKPYFVYAVSYLGVTGKKIDYVSLGNYINKVKKTYTGKIAIGFGIKTGTDAKKIKKIADVVVVGTAFVNVITENYKDSKKLIKKINVLLKDLVSNLK